MDAHDKGLVMKGLGTIAGVTAVAALGFMGFATQKGSDFPWWPSIGAGAICVLSAVAWMVTAFEVGPFRPMVRVSAKERRRAGVTVNRLLDLVAEGKRLQGKAPSAKGDDAEPPIADVMVEIVQWWDAGSDALKDWPSEQKDLDTNRLVYPQWHALSIQSRHNHLQSIVNALRGRYGL